MSGIILFGDSVLFGTGASTRNQGCGRVLKNLSKCQVLIKSRNLDTTEDALLRIEKDVLGQHDFNNVVVLFGNNDCRLKGVNTPVVSLETYMINLKTIIQKIKLVNKIPLICNLQPISSDGFFKVFPETKKFIRMDSTPYLWQKNYSDICVKVSGEEGIELVDIRSPLEAQINNVLADDGLHPNDLGHRIIAQQMLSILIKNKN